MHISDSQGRIVGMFDLKDKMKIRLINPNKPIRVKKIQATSHSFCHFYYMDKKNKEVTIPMKNIIEDGVLDKGDYVYKIVN